MAAVAGTERTQSMRTHEKALVVVIAVAAVAVASSPHWLPAVAAPAPRVAKAAPPPVEEPPARPRREPMPPFDPAAFARHLRTEHYAIASNATEQETAQVGEVVEALHAAYADFFAGALPPRPDGMRHQLALYRDRADFQAHNTSRPWAEGFYVAPACHAYYDGARPNAVHWMLHEAAHQLDQEWGGFGRMPWIGEGLAAYFATSRLDDAGLHPGELEPDTYPLWWLGELHLSGDRQADFMARRLVPLRELIEADAPQRRDDVNAYYIGYWSLAHYLLHGDGGRHAAAFRAMVADGGTLEDFERRVGPVEAVEQRWYAHLLAQRDALEAARVARR
jgi:hypothetical protein